MRIEPGTAHMTACHFVVEDPRIPEFMDVYVTVERGRDDPYPAHVILEPSAELPSFLHCPTQAEGRPIEEVIAEAIDIYALRFWNVIQLAAEGCDLLA